MTAIEWTDATWNPGWATAKAWEEILVPWIARDGKGADGTWSITHGIEVSR